MITLMLSLKRWQQSIMMQSMNLKRREKNERSFKRNSINTKLELQGKFERLVKEIDSRLCSNLVSSKLKKFLKKILVILNKPRWKDEFGKKKLESCWMNIKLSWRVCRTSTCRKWHRSIKRIFRTYLQSMKFYRLITRKSNQRRVI